LQDWSLRFGFGQRRWPIRRCALRKGQVAAEPSERRVRRKAQLKQRQPSPRALEWSQDSVVLTNLDPDTWRGAHILELYRCRWQIELAFKRLKGLLKLGHLPKQDPASARAWMQLKLLLALVIEKLCYDARLFSPWGYRVELQPLGRVARNG
jgi:IS4 transposase